MHGYIIVQQAAASPMFGGKKPDATGIYRALKRMEEGGLVSSVWDLSLIHIYCAGWRTLRGRWPRPPRSAWRS